MLQKLQAERRLLATGTFRDRDCTGTRLFLLLLPPGASHPETPGPADPRCRAACH